MLTELVLPTNRFSFWCVHKFFFAPRLACAGDSSALRRLMPSTFPCGWTLPVRRGSLRLPRGAGLLCHLTEAFPREDVPPPRHLIQNSASV